MRIALTGKGALAVNEVPAESEAPAGNETEALIGEEARIESEVPAGNETEALIGKEARTENEVRPNPFAPLTSRQRAVTASPVLCPLPHQSSLVDR
jgi:hypothetical protein